MAALLALEIQERSLAPGERLGTETELAERMGTTRPAVREAVRLLVAANLLRASRGPGGGVFVANTPAQGLARTVSGAIDTMMRSGATGLGELIEVRALLEVPVAGLAALRADAATIGRLRECVDVAQGRLDDRSVQLSAYRRFHETLAEAAGNPVAAALMAWAHDVLAPELDRLIAPAIVAAVVVEQHRQILAAVGAGEAAAAEHAMRSHLSYIGDVLETVAPGSAAAYS